MVRRGHSLAEMVVALAFLGAALAGISATGVLSARRTRDAVHLQEATALATALIDSLVATSGPVAGELASPWGRLEWEVAGSGAGGRWVEVRVSASPGTRGPGNDTLALLRSAWIPPAPALPEPRP